MAGEDRLSDFHTIDDWMGDSERDYRTQKEAAS